MIITTIHLYSHAVSVLQLLLYKTFNFADVFEALVPVAVHQAMAAYSVRKTELVNTEIMRLREATQLLNR